MMSRNPVAPSHPPVDDAAPRLDFLPWEYARGATEADRHAQAERRRRLAETGDIELALAGVLGRWVDGHGLAFAPDGSDDRSVPGLQGTEMWLAIVWLLCDYLGFSDVLGYRPRG